MSTRTTRERLIDATEQIIRSGGIMAVTTKDIAQAAGFAEGTLYRHFPDKTALLLAVYSERMQGSFLGMIHNLPQRAGEATVAENLEHLAAAAAQFFAHTAPLSAAMSADPDLAARHSAEMRALGIGPEMSARALADYIRAEQRLGRVRADVNPAAVAAILLGVAYNFAQARLIYGEHPSGLTEEQFAPEVVRTLIGGLAPPR
jgi:AcrR family transcriptional regulator